MANAYPLLFLTMSYSGRVHLDSGVVWGGDGSGGYLLTPGFWIFNAYDC